MASVPAPKPTPPLVRKRTYFLSIYDFGWIIDRFSLKNVAQTFQSKEKVKSCSYTKMKMVTILENRTYER